MRRKLSTVFPFPPWFVAGDQDAVTKPEASELINSCIPSARLITLAPAKHLGLFEHHTRYAEAIREFALADQAQAGRSAA